MVGVKIKSFHNHIRVVSDFNSKKTRKNSKKTRKEKQNDEFRMV